MHCEHTVFRTRCRRREETRVGENVQPSKKCCSFPEVLGPGRDKAYLGHNEKIPETVSDI